MPPSMPAFAATPAAPQPAAPSGAATPATAANAVPPAVAPAIVAQTEQPPPAAKTESSPAPAASAAPVANVASTTPPAAPTQPVGVGFQLPPGCPPLALDGYCPVSVTDKMVWKKGDVKFGAIHRGRTYLFATDEEQKKFLADPDRYSPVMSGNDPVVVLEKGENVAGKREFGLMCEKRMFLFSSKESYDKFCSDSKRYSTQTFQAMQQAGDGVIRR
jgi:protein disulfide-isomerase